MLRPRRRIKLLRTQVNGARLRVVFALGTAQTLAWASSYYLPAIVADPIARDLGVSSNWIFGVFSASLILSAVIAPAVGRRIDRVGGRQVLSASNLTFAAGLGLLSVAHSLPTLLVAWIFLGLGMSLGLYDAAFAALGRLYGDDARPSITGITLIAGFASTIGWPLTAWGVETIGWRETCLAWAAAHILLGLPLNALLLPKVTPHVSQGDAAPAKPHIPIDRTMVMLALTFAAAWTVTGAMAVHLPRILESAGATTVQAVAAGALIGPAQVFARILEASVFKHVHPLITTRVACLTHPVGVAVLALGGGGTAAAFGIFHGTGSGILTIARGTLPLAIYGPVNYGYRLGILAAPARLAQAAAPLVFGLLIEHLGSHVLAVSAALSLSAFAALASLPSTNRPLENHASGS